MASVRLRMGQGVEGPPGPSGLLKSYPAFGRKGQ
jgi:hypothetical protein